MSANTSTTKTATSIKEDEVLTVLSEEQPHDGGRTSGTLKTTVEVQRYAHFTSCRRLEASIEAKLGRSTEFAEAGYIVGYLVDKSVLASQGKSAWVQELLVSNDRAKDNGTEELRFCLRTLFDKNGTVKQIKKAENEFIPEASADRIVFVDSILLDKEHRGTGAAQLALQSFHRLIRSFINGKARSKFPTVVSILSPARSDDERLKKGKTDVDVENGLIRSYRKSGYEVWIKGDEGTLGSVTVMGRSLGQDVLEASAEPNEVAKKKNKRSQEENEESESEVDQEVVRDEESTQETPSTKKNITKKGSGHESVDVPIEAKPTEHPEPRRSKRIKKT